jgi:hypothetical protein
MLLLNAADDTTRPTHLPPPPMTNRRIRRLTNKEIREIAEDEIPVALERLMGGSHDARAIAFAELTKFARAIIACAIATPAPEELEPNDTDVGRILRLAEIVREVDGKYELGAAALAEAILAHPGFSGCHDGPAAPAAQGVLDDRYEFSVVDSDDCEQAGGSAPTLDDAIREGRNYLRQYNQDGPHRLELRRVLVLNHSEATNA